MLYVSGALVVAIVVVIIFLTHRVEHRVLALIPRGEKAIQIVDWRRFLKSPLYRQLKAARHLIARGLVKRMGEGFGVKDFGLRLESDVRRLADTDRLTIFVGRFRPRRLREAFIELIEEQGTRKARIGPAPAKGDKALQQQGMMIIPPIRLKVHEGDIEGRKYYYCDQAGTDRGFSSAGSSIVCYGDHLAVKRFVRVRAGLRDSVLEDTDLMAAHQRDLARGALLYRLEKPGGKFLARALKRMLIKDTADVCAACFALDTSQTAIDATIRLAAVEEKAAERLEETLSKAAKEGALDALLGGKAPPKVTRSGALVVLKGSVTASDFGALVEKGKAGPKDNLILDLLAN